MFYKNTRKVLINNMELKVLYHDEKFGELERISKIEQGDWIDLRAAETVEFKKGEFKIISLGITVVIPDGYEMNIVPRSSTYKNFKILQTNCFGVIDNSYSGFDDIVGFPALAMEDTVIHKGDRICQFRLNKKMEDLDLIEVKEASDKSRGGFGSTGKK